MVIYRGIKRAGVMALCLVFSGLSEVVLGASPALVMDVASGHVLHEENATQPWFPASLTKLMTTYVALREIRSGRVSAHTPLTVSTRAAAAPPSKMRFKPGLELTLDNALKILMVKSANDVAITVAEGLGGSVEGFAAMMNREAARLGMSQSHFTNPHGLPDAQQVTSARDMGLLAQAILAEFPDRQDLFAIGAIRLGNKIMKNHNGLMGRYPGADGMKTGFICSSGFNVVASATRGGRRLVTVVMGSPSATERTIRAAALFDQGFATSAWGNTSRQLRDLPALAFVSAPDMRQDICGAHRRQAEDDAETASLVPPSAGNANPVLDILAAPSMAGIGMAGIGQTSVGHGRKLSPRAPLTVVDVFIGRSPNALPQQASAYASVPSGADSPLKSGKPTLSAKKIRAKNQRNFKRTPKNTSLPPVSTPRPVADIIADPAPRASHGAIRPKPRPLREE
jgi:D-alanyl-D-alanine carboxypeptidase